MCALYWVAVISPANPGKDKGDAPQMRRACLREKNLVAEVPTAFRRRPLPVCKSIERSEVGSARSSCPTGFAQ